MQRPVPTPVPLYRLRRRSLAWWTPAGVGLRPHLPLLRLGSLLATVLVLALASGWQLWRLAGSTAATREAAAWQARVTGTEQVVQQLQLQVRELESRYVA